ncbi:hypothetical protein DIPPA_17776 [Diplonema papillatum]|nr:hypothetical protein DIPPA_17776 [Diplonema papillatum]
MSDPIFTNAVYRQEPVPKALLTHFGGLFKDGPHACQVVEKLHSRSGKTLRVILLQKFFLRKTETMETALFVCTLSGRVKKVLKMADIIEVIITNVEHTEGLLHKVKTDVLQVLIRNRLEQDLLINLIHHKMNSNHATYRVLDVLRYMYEEAVGRPLEISDLRCARAEMADLRQFRVVSKKPDSSVRDRLEEWRHPDSRSASDRGSREFKGPPTLSPPLEPHPGHEITEDSLVHTLNTTLDRTTHCDEIDLTLGGDRLDHYLDKKYQHNRDAQLVNASFGSDVSDDSQVEDVEAALRAYTLAT